MDDERRAEAERAVFLPPVAPGRAPSGWERPEAAWPAPTRARPAPSFRPAPAADAENGAAVGALVCGILGLLVIAGTAGILFIVSLPLSITAWILGVKGQRRADRGETGQRGLAQAGWIVGVVGTILGLLALVGWTVLFLLADDGFFDDLDRDLRRDGYPVALTAAAGLATRIVAAL